MIGAAVNVYANFLRNRGKYFVIFLNIIPLILLQRLRALFILVGIP